MVGLTATFPEHQTLMSQSPTRSPPPPTNTSQIPVEIISDEEMDLIEAAFAAATSTLSSSSSISIPSCSSQSTILYSSSASQFQNNARSIESITLNTKRTSSGCSQNPVVVDIEDLGTSGGSKKKKRRTLESFLQRFRRKRGLAVTDITASEWCEKQMEFILLHGRPKATAAMKAGTDRHLKLEQEVIEKVEVNVETAEDAWAIKFMNFIVGANQLLFEGLTREIPLIGLVKGVWMVGVIDEIRMPITEAIQRPLLVDTKTRSQATLPGEAQKRNGRLQLMCYKYLWNNAVTNKFPASRFYIFFGLNPRAILSKQIQDLMASSGFCAETLDDLVMYFRNACCTLPPADDQLLLRYEYQGDHSLLGEDQFAYDADWLMSQLTSCLDFWSGEREANFVSEEEQWKCRFCRFVSICPNTNNSDTKTNSDPS